MHLDMNIGLGSGIADGGIFNGDSQAIKWSVLAVDCMRFTAIDGTSVRCDHAKHGLVRLQGIVDHDIKIMQARLWRHIHGESLHISNRKDQAERLIEKARRASRMLSKLCRDGENMPTVSDLDDIHLLVAFCTSVRDNQPQLGDDPYIIAAIQFIEYVQETLYNRQIIQEKDRLDTRRITVNMRTCHRTNHLTWWSDHHTT